MSLSWQKGTRFRNNFVENISDQNKLTHSKEKKASVFLFCEKRKKNFAKLNEKDISDDRKF